MRAQSCVFHYALYEYLYCLHTIDLYRGICALDQFPIIIFCLNHMNYVCGVTVISH